MLASYFVFTTDAQNAMNALIFLGKLCRLLDESDGKIEPFQEILTDSYIYVRRHTPSEGVAKSAYVQKITAIRDILVSVIVERLRETN